MQAVECDIARDDVPFQSASGEIRVSAVFKVSVLNQHVLHAAVAELASRGVSAVETHECFFQAVIVPASDMLAEHGLGDRVVDIQEGDCVVGQAGSDIF